MLINNKLLDVHSIEFEGIDGRDYPDFCDAFIADAYFIDGTSLSQCEIDELNNDRDFLYKTLIDRIF